MSRYLDSNVLIYAVEGERGLQFTEASLAILEEGEFSTSLLTWIEVAGIRHAPGHEVVLARYEAIFRSRTIRALPITESVIMKAAEFVGKYRLKSPDAIHAACAVIEGCTEFITNDPHFKRVDELNVRLLSEESL